MAFKRLFIAILLTVSANYGLAKSAILLDDPALSYDIRIDMINRAQKGDTLDITYYIVKGDYYGVAFFDALLQAADRGAHVRFLVDDLNNNYPKALWAMTQLYDNFEAKFFRPFPNLNPRTVGRRLHDKFMILNNEEIIFGGRNIAREYFNMSSGLIDTDIWMDGPIAAQAGEYFEKIWSYKKSKPARFGRYKYKTEPMMKVFNICNKRKIPTDCLTHYKELLRNEYHYRCRVPGPGSHIDKCDRQFKSVFRNHMELWKAREDLKETREFFASIEDIRREQYEELKTPYESATWHDNFDNVSNWRRGVDENSLTGVLYQAIRDTKARGWISAPYLISTKAMHRAFGEASRNNDGNVEFAIATNSTESSGLKIITLASMQRQKNLEERGVQIFRKAGKGHLHSKIAVFDYDKIFVSSHNMDPRSEKLNSESGAVIISPELNEQLTQTMIGIFRGSWLDDRQRINRKFARKGHYGIWDHVMHQFSDKILLSIPGAEDQL